jgi:hypothetical protein
LLGVQNWFLHRFCLIFALFATHISSVHFGVLSASHRKI